MSRSCRHGLVTFAALAVILSLPALACADGYIGPGIGVAFGNRSARGLADLTLSACWLYQEPIGVELDTTFAPGFFDNQGAYGSNGVTTVMGNVMFAAREPGGHLPRGLHRGNTVRPYISGGLGWIHERANIPAISRTDLGTDVGVGVLATTATQVGVRADIRYYRDLVGSSESGQSSIDFGAFHFWRASIGVLFRF